MTRKSYYIIDLILFLSHFIKNKKKIVFGDENWFCKAEAKMFEIAFFTSEVVETLLDKEQVESNKH